MRKSIQNLKECLIEIPEVKRIHELEHYIDTNEYIQDAFTRLKNKQKQLVTAREFQQTKQMNMYQQEYNEIYQELLDLPFVEEYLELLEYVNQILKELALEIESKVSMWTK